MTRGVKICLAVVAALFIGSVIACVILFKPAESRYIEIVQNGTVIRTIDLANAEDQTFRIESPDGGWNDITIEDGRVRVSDADCPDGTCIRTGERTSYSTMILQVGVPYGGDDATDFNI